MAYIGREPQIGNYQVCDAISVVNAQAAYTMQVSSVNVIPESVNHMIVSLNGVIQKPGSSYTISGATITFSRNLVTGETIDFIYLLGNVLDLGTPSDDTVTGAKIVDNAINSEHYTDGSIDTAHIADAQVTLAKLAADSVNATKIVDNAINSEHYTDGSIDTAHIADGQVTIGKLATAVLTGATDIGAAIADADLLLVDDGAGGTLRKTAASRLKTYVGGNPISLADQWHVTAGVTDIGANSDTVVTNWTQDGYTGYGKIGTMSESSGIFTFPSTGMYLVELALQFYYASAASAYNYTRLQITTDNSNYNTRSETTTFTRGSENYITSSPASAIIDVTSTSNVKVRAAAHVRNAGTDLEGGSIVRSYFKFIRLGDT